jgi:hypothetical protein
MATLLIFHEVDDVDRWLASPRREELAGAQGFTARLFRDPQGSNRVGIILEVPDMASFEKMLEADPTWESAKADGVRVDTAVILHEV